MITIQTAPNQGLMHPYLVRLRTFLPALTLAAIIPFGGCGHTDLGADVLDQIHAGMPRDSVLSILGSGPLAATGNDSVRIVGGFRHMRYLRDGKMIEVIYYRAEPGSVSEPIQQDRETPIVLRDDRALGWGWRYYGEAMTLYGLPTVLFQDTKPGDSTARRDSAGTGR